MKIFQLNVIYCVIAALFLSSCMGGVQPDPVPQQPATPPEQVVQSFYDWYLERPESGPKDIRESVFVAPELIKKVSQASSSDEQVEHLNLICAQDFPESVTVERAVIAGDEAKVPVKTSWGSELELTLETVEGAWKISAVQCK